VCVRAWVCVHLWGVRRAGRAIVGLCGVHRNRKSAPGGVRHGQLSSVQFSSVQGGVPRARSHGRGPTAALRPPAQPENRERSRGRSRSGSTHSRPGSARSRTGTRERFKNLPKKEMFAAPGPGAMAAFAGSTLTAPVTAVPEMLEARTMHCKSQQVLSRGDGWSTLQTFPARAARSRIRCTRPPAGSKTGAHRVLPLPRERCSRSAPGPGAVRSRVGSTHSRPGG
jgi:hypothetical protein